MAKPIMILSPQTDFGNQIRLLCSGIILAKSIGRIPMYFWPESDNFLSSEGAVAGESTKKGWEDFFLPHREFLPADPYCVPFVDISFSEWLEEEYWYSRQNLAHKAWKRVPDFRCTENADSLQQYNDHQVLLLESSRELKLSQYSTEEWQNMMMETYQKYFKPLPAYIEVLKNIPSFDVGITIRRGEFLHYFPEENYSESILMNWLTTVISKESGKSIVLFSDDYQLRDMLRNHLKSMNVDCSFPDIDGFEPWEIEYLEFLTMATRVTQRIYGTPKSSFGEQAAIYGGLPFVAIKPKEDKFELLTQQIYKLDCTQKDEVTIAILAKDKGHLLPLYLELIERQTYPTSLIKLYIRTNNNRDNTKEILEKWVNRVKGRYSEIYFNCEDIEQPVQNYAPHEWNTMRLEVIGKLRQESIEWACSRGTHYFVIDCDNFVIPETLEMLVQTRLPVVGPLLRHDSPTSMYSNYHFKADENGYFQASHLYNELLYRNVKGIVEVDVIHCTYFIRHEVLEKVKYVDGSGRFEYVIFSDTLRKKGIPQYLDNRLNYGILTFCDTAEEFLKLDIDIETFIKLGPRVETPVFN